MDLNRIYDNEGAIEVKWGRNKITTKRRRIVVDMHIGKDDFKFFLKRTVDHIHRVQKNMVLLCSEYQEKLDLSEDDVQVLMHNVMNHDRSKFSVEQFTPYLMLTKYYRHKATPTEFNYSPYDKVCVDNAVEHHYKSENHHPEMFKPGALGKWDKFNAYECACDLQAMAEEFEEGTCRSYYEEKWLPKYSKESGFYDDYNWGCIKTWMNEAITCFEDNYKKRKK